MILPMWEKRRSWFGLLGLVVALGCGERASTKPSQVGAEPPRELEIRQASAEVPASPPIEGGFGPMLGTVALQAPLPRRYSATYDFRLSKLPTREISVTRSVDGHAIIELGKDGVATACFAIHSQRDRSESKYSSSDGKHHREDNDERLLLGGKGHWLATGDMVQLTLDTTWANSCTEPTTLSSLGPVQLGCVGIAKNKKLPVELLACQLKQNSVLDLIAINPADSPRAGPFRFQSVPRHVGVDEGKAWLLLGMAPGVLVTSKDFRRQTSPEVRFESAAVSINESFFAPL